MVFSVEMAKKAKAKVKVTLKIAEQVTEHMPETLIEFMFNLGTLKVIHPKYFEHLAYVLAHKMGFDVQ